MLDLILLTIVVAGMIAFLVAVPLIMTRGRGNKWTDNGTIDFNKFNRENSRSWVMGGMNKQTRPVFLKSAQKQATRISDQQSGKRLVDAIALRHPIVLFMSGSKATPTADEVTLLEILDTLQLRPYLASTDVDPLIRLALPVAQAGTTDLPYLYIGGRPFGGALAVLSAIKDGRLAVSLEGSRIDFDADAASALRQT